MPLHDVERFTKQSQVNLQTMNTVGFYNDYQVSIINSEIFEGSDSETEGSSTERKFGITAGLGGVVRVEEGGMEYSKIERSFVLGMGIRSRKETKVVAIHKNTNQSVMARARMETFRIHSQAVARKCGGNANVRFAWYGGSRDEIVDVVNRGFSRARIGGRGGIGVHLSHSAFSRDSALLTESDEEELRHVLLCRVILGNMEAVPEGSNQFRPSSEQFDSGADNVTTPRRYIVWNAFMNSCIFPNYIISFKSPSLNGSQRKLPSLLRRPASPWMSFSVLMYVLSRFLDSSKMGLIRKHYNDFRARKILRPQLIQRMRQIAGDRLLVHVIKLHINK